ncbi:MAG TPA: HD domain-containing protein [Thermoanaerobaculia bacterium]|nr:HD domain-containing protein [Thermoanaerobaculia bacterium]
MALLSVRDPVHGFIHADALETELVASRPLQRLRSIRQLGLTHLIFPGAEHSRFSHALGAMHLAGRLYDALAAKSDGLLDHGPRAPGRRALRAAALLHDVGHAPFSHTAESLFDQPIDHEEMTRRLLGLPEIETAFERHDGDLEFVLRLLSGEVEGPTRLLAQAMSGELDVDKMDYLLRDSMFCGVQYGRFDLDRILDTVVPIQDPESGRWGLGVEQGGVHALEALVLARYYMFTQVYFNPTSKALELHLNEWLRESGRRWPADPEGFLELDDVEVMVELRRSPSPHARAIVDRRHYPLAFETGEHLSADQRQRFSAILAEVAAVLAPGDLLCSHSAKDPHRLEASGVLVRHRDGRLEPLAAASHFIRHLGRIERFRVYAPPARCAAVAAEIGRRWRET